MAIDVFRNFKACYTDEKNHSVLGTYATPCHFADMTDMTTSEPFLMQQAAALLAAAERKSLQHVTVESCTGGLLASLLTDVEGLSHIFNRR